MFCPKCGSADQTKNSYCRQCGVFLPDFEKVSKKATPEDHLKVNTVLNFLTGIVSITLAILLYYFFLGKENTPVIIYITGGFLIAIFGWQVQTFWRTLLLKKQIVRKNENILGNENKNIPKTNFPKIETREFLNEANTNNFIQPSITERTTKNLVGKNRN